MDTYVKCEVMKADRWKALISNNKSRKGQQKDCCSYAPTSFTEITEPVKIILLWR